MGHGEEGRMQSSRCVGEGRGVEAREGRGSVEWKREKSFSNVKREADRLRISSCVFDAIKETLN